VLPTAWRAPALALSAQGFGALQLVLLVLVGGSADRYTDAYFFLFAWTALPPQLVISSALYPLWLRGSALYESRARRLSQLAAACSLASTFVALWIFSETTHSTAGLIPLATFLGVNGLIASWSTANAFRAAALGDSVFLSALYLPANICACVALAVTHGLPQQFRVTAMAVALILGNCVYLLCWSRSAARAACRLSGAGESKSMRVGEIGLLSLRGAAGYGAGLALLTAASTLPPASLSLVSVYTRTVGALSSVINNTVLPRLVHRDTGSTDGVQKLIRWILLVAGLGGIPAVALSAFMGPDVQVTVFSGLAWLVGITVNAAAQRVALRFASVRTSLIAVVVAVGTVGIVLTTIGTSAVSLAMIMTAFVCLDLATGALYLVVVRQHTVALLSVGLTGVLMFLGVWL
jgi:hypothetical protein